MNIEEKLHAFTLAESLAGIGHWSIDLSSNEIYWSDYIYRIHGITPNEYTPELESSIEFYHPDDREYVQNLVSRSIEQGQDFEFSLRLVRKDGCIRNVNAKANCIKDINGDVTRIFGIFQDITDDVSLGQARVAHQSLMESTNDGYWDWFINEDYQYMSPRFWEIFGYLPEEKPHKPSAWQDLIFEEDLQVALENYDKHVKTKGRHPYNQEVRYRHKNGSTVTVLCRGRVIEWDDNDQPIRMIGTHTDITELKHIENTLRDTLDFQKLLANANSDLVFVKDAEFKIVDANEAFLSLYPGKTLQDIKGTTTVEEYDEKDAELFLAEDKNALETGLSEVAETIMFPDGKERTLLTRKMRFSDRDGTPLILGVARDITGMRRTEQALLRANEELKEFAYRTSHDLRSPLVSSRRLLSIVQSLLNKGELEKAKSHLTLVESSLESLETLVSDLLSLTQFEHEEIKTGTINFSDLVSETTAKLGHMEGFSQVTFTTDFSHAEDAHTSEIHLRHILENLISNAIKYQDPNAKTPTITVTSSTKNHYFEFSVSDNGIGIPEHRHDQLFEMFKRFHPKTAFGSGLGLYMVKKNIERLGGSIQYTPLTQGSKFTVRIPIPVVVEDD